MNQSSWLYNLTHDYMPNWFRLKKIVSDGRKETLREGLEDEEEVSQAVEQQTNK